MKIESPGTDFLSIRFEARCNPLAEGDAGLDPFFDALEVYAGEWMPERVGGPRPRKYSRAAAFKRLKENAQTILGHPAASFYRSSPFVEMSLAIHRLPWPKQFKVWAKIYPLSLVEEPMRAERWSRAIIDLVRAWSSCYPVNHAYVHSGTDAYYSWWEGDPSAAPEEAPFERLKALYWLNVFNKAWVDALGRQRVLSTPAHHLEELPNGAVLFITRPTPADWRSEEGRSAQARALVHLRPELDFDVVLRELLERSALFEPVEPRFDIDSAPLLQRVVAIQRIDEQPRKTAELNAWRPPEVDEWLPTEAAPASDVPDPDASLEGYQGQADALSSMLHPDVPDYFDAPPDALTDLDYRLWLGNFPEFYEREKIDHELFPSVGAYLGFMLVRHLGGRWVPRRKPEETQVVVGDRAWLPFLRTRRYLQTTQSLLDYSLTKFYRTAARYHAPRQG